MTETPFCDRFGGSNRGTADHHVSRFLRMDPESLEISIGTVTTDELYGGQSLDVLTQESAGTAGDVLDNAIDTVTSVRAEVGALQSRFDFASANIESSLQNQDSARAVLLDTDIAAESTAFATAQVQLQAGISVLAQANLLQQNLLKLIG